MPYLTVSYSLEHAMVQEPNNICRNDLIPLGQPDILEPRAGWNIDILR